MLFILRRFGVYSSNISIDNSKDKFIVKINLVSFIFEEFFMEDMFFIEFKNIIDFDLEVILGREVLNFSYMIVVFLILEF